MYTYTIKVTRHLGHFFYLTTASRSVWLWRRKFYIKLSMALKVIQDYIRLLLCQNRSSTFVYGPILIKNLYVCNIMKSENKNFHKIINNLKCHFYVLWFLFFKTFWPNYNLDLHSYRQLLSLVLNYFQTYGKYLLIVSFPISILTTQ